MMEVTVHEHLLGNEDDLSREHSGNPVELDLCGRSLQNLSIGVLSKIRDFPGSLLTHLMLADNRLKYLDEQLFRCASALRVIDISENGLMDLPPAIGSLSQLEKLVINSNKLSSLPKELELCSRLWSVSIAANNFKDIPMAALSELNSLQALYMGGNHISAIRSDIARLSRLRVLYLGGNRITEISPAIGELSDLTVLHLGDNMLAHVPNEIGRLIRLHTLSLHNNALQVLPLELLQIHALTELSLRGNPLVKLFAAEMHNEPASLVELAARSIKKCNIDYASADVPENLKELLDSGHSCENPHCQGVYFSESVRHVQFVDFCGKFRVPLMQYLCGTSNCTRRVHDESYTNRGIPVDRVLMSPWESDRPVSDW